MFFQEMAIRMAISISENAMLFGLSEDNEAALKELAKKLKSENKEVPYQVQKILGWIEEDEPLDVSDRSGNYHYELTWVESKLSFSMLLDAKKEELREVIQSEVEKRLSGTDWEISRILDISEEEESKKPFEIINKISKNFKPKKFNIKLIANNNNAIKSDTEEGIVKELSEFREIEFENLKVIFGDDITIEIMSKDTDIIIIND